MEIEYSKADSKQNNDPIEEEKVITPVKEKTGQSPNLTLTEKCQVYTYVKEGKNSTEIARSIARAPRTISKLIEKAKKKKKTLDNQHGKLNKAGFFG